MRGSMPAILSLPWPMIYSFIAQLLKLLNLRIILLRADRGAAVRAAIEAQAAVLTAGRAGNFSLFNIIAICFKLQRALKGGAAASSPGLTAGTACPKGGGRLAGAFLRRLPGPDNMSGPAAEGR